MLSLLNFYPANPASLIVSHHFSFPSFISRWFDNAFAASPAISLLSSLSLKSTLRSNPTAKPRSLVRHTINASSKSILGKTKESRGVVTRWTNSKRVSILIAGNRKSGQRHLASCLLYCFVVKCAGVQSCVVFMPRIHLWAVETHFQVAENSNHCSTIDMAKGKDNGSVNGDEVKVQLPEPSKVPSPPTRKPVKQKSTLLLAISTFGYQISRFPHFAELCWVTSKLKEGPSADVREVSSEIRKVLEILVGKINTKVQAGR
ncbi:hypothetical protein K1719_039557 [Acacia pycnantha]|nr:hypothetical protein K1719_039557 [Acacia pycnantha]